MRQLGHSPVPGQAPDRLNDAARVALAFLEHRRQIGAQEIVVDQVWRHVPVERLGGGHGVPFFGKPTTVAPGLRKCSLWATAVIFGKYVYTSPQVRQLIDA